MGGGGARSRRTAACPLFARGRGRAPAARAPFRHFSKEPAPAPRRSPASPSVMRPCGLPPASGGASAGAAVDEDAARNWGGGGGGRNCGSCTTGAAPACTARSPRRRRRPARRSPRAFAAAAGTRSRRTRCSGAAAPARLLGRRVRVGVGLRAVLRRRRLRAVLGRRPRVVLLPRRRVARPGRPDPIPVANGRRGLVVPSVVRVAVVLRHPTVRRPSLLARLGTRPRVLARPLPSLRVEPGPGRAARHIGIRTGRRRRCCRAKIFRGRQRPGVFFFFLTPPPRQT